MKDKTDDAVRLAYVIEKADSRRRIGHSLGFALINYGRLFVRDYWTLFSIARELDCGVSDLVGKEERRTKWDVLVRAAEEILAAVQALPAPLRMIVEERGSGHSWRRILRRHPDRLIFSMREDYDRALRVIQGRASVAVLTLLTEENISVVSTGERA